MSLKSGFCAVALALGIAVSAQAQSVYLVRVSDMAKNDGYEVLTREEVAALQKAVTEETRAYPAALAAVKKAWDEDEATKKTPFPSAKLSARKLQPKGPLPRDQAEKQKEKAVERLDAAMVKAMEEKKKKGSSAAAKADAEKEAKREQSVAEAHDKLREKMKELLGREVPKNGF